ncbi:aspartate carbamoyltransferase [Planctomycetota bacterium]
MKLETLKAMSAEEQYGLFKREERLFHFVKAGQLGRTDLLELGQRADRIRALGADEAGLRQLNSLLPHKRVMLYFNQPSSRTFFSFMNACHILGMRVCENRDPSLTSEKKGESFADTICTFASYTDMIIMRNSDNDAALKAVAALQDHSHTVPVVNAGSGTSEHPTQALLDIYTLMREFKELGGIDGKKILMAGDLARGRTVRSLSYLLAEFKDVELYFAAVPAFQMKDDIREFLTGRGISFQDVDDMSEALPEMDAVYMTRVQDEHDTSKGASAAVASSAFHFETAYLDRMKPGAVVLHPLPRREEIPPEVDADPRAGYWRQEENGMWARAALIAAIFNAEIE